MRYLIFTRTQLPDGRTVLAETFSNKVKLIHEQTSQIILDFKTQSVVKTNLDTTDWHETITQLWPTHHGMLGLMYDVHKLDNPFKPQVSQVDLDTALANANKQFGNQQENTIDAEYTIDND